MEALEALIAENPDLPQTGGLLPLHYADYVGGLRPLHYAVENDAPLDIIKVLAKARPEIIVMDYYKIVQGGRFSRHDVISESKDAAIRAYLRDEAMLHLHSRFSNEKQLQPVQEFFMNHAVKDVGLIDRMLELFPDMSKDFTPVNKLVEDFTFMNMVVNDGCTNEILQRLKDIWYPRAFAERTDG